MDCCICSPVAGVYRLPRNAICAPCHEGAKAIIGFLNKDDGQQQEEDGGHGSVLKSRVSAMKPDSATKGMRDAWEQVKEMRGREEEAHQRAAFLAQGLVMDQTRVYKYEARRYPQYIEILLNLKTEDAAMNSTEALAEAVAASGRRP